jgi:putative alpha-1,2-mannosidase
MYSDQPAGVAGNDDGGTLGAWYVLTTLGVYPIPGSDRWLVVAPLFPRARVRVGGHELVIEAPDAGERTPYVKSVKLDGVELDVLEITHAQLTTASRLEFVMSSKPGL